jgi:hypothetical protein
LIKADESDLFGARVGYALKTGWSVFLDGGVQDAEDDVDPVVQIGTQYSLPLEGSVGFAIRAAAYMPFISDYDYLFGVNLGILGSAPIEAVKGLSVYGGIGVLHERWDYGSTWVKETYHYDIYGNLISVDREKGGDRTEAAISAGLIYQISEQASIYFEFADIADTFLGGGFRFDL